MLEIIEIKSWSHFEEIIQRKLRTQRDTLISMGNIPYLFRGQSDSTWRLETTLDRYVKPNVLVSFYARMIKEILPEIETFTGKDWIIPESQSHKDLIEYSDLPYEYLTYLRHHGFPSPLLDWSYSPYVAAYFAFRDMGSNAKSVAIYAYRPIYYINPLPNKPQIKILWGDGKIKSNKRHYLQQSEYTICVRNEENVSRFANYEDIYLEEGDKREDITKYILPASERGMALLSLEPYNINAYSLMGTEESLLETLFLRFFSIMKARNETIPNWHNGEYE